MVKEGDNHLPLHKENLAIKISFNGYLLYLLIEPPGNAPVWVPLSMTS